VKIFLNNLSEIMTKSGVFRIDKIIPQKTILLNGVGEFSYIKSITPKEKIKMYHLELKNGAVISIGENTLVQTENGKKKIQDVKPDEYIAYSFGILKNTKREKPIFWEDKNHPNALPIKIPKSMSEDLCLWLGIVASKGRYSEEHNKIVLSFMDDKIQKIFSDLTYKVFKFYPAEYKDDRCNLLTPTIRSPNLIRFLNFCFGSNSNLKKVPSIILDGSLTDQLSFIKGLTLDGYVDQNQLIVYGGVSKRIADFTAMVLRNCGYSVHQQMRKSGGGNSIYYTKITGKTDYALKVEALEPHKNENISGGGFFVAITPEILATPIKSEHPNYSAFRNIKQRGSKVCYNHTLDKLDIYYSQEKHFVLIKDITTSEQDGFSVELNDKYGLVFQGIILGQEKDTFSED
jgi:hypothetical protein